jgi:hypothetical protein
MKDMLDARFEVLAAVLMNIEVFLDLTPCLLVKSFRHFERYLVSSSVSCCPENHYDPLKCG